MKSSKNGFNFKRRAKETLAMALSMLMVLSVVLVPGRVDAQDRYYGNETGDAILGPGGEIGTGTVFFPGDTVAITSRFASFYYNCRELDKEGFLTWPEGEETSSGVFTFPEKPLNDASNSIYVVQDPGADPAEIDVTLQAYPGYQIVLYNLDGSVYANNHYFCKEYYTAGAFEYATDLDTFPVLERSDDLGNCIGWSTDPYFTVSSEGSVFASVSATASTLTLLENIYANNISLVEFYPVYEYVKSNLEISMADCELSDFASEATMPKPTIESTNRPSDMQTYTVRYARFEDDDTPVLLDEGELPSTPGNYRIYVTMDEGGETSYDDDSVSTRAFSSVTADADFEVTGKMNITPSVSLEDWTYGETANTPTVTGNTGNGEVTYNYKAKDADDSKYSTDIPSDAGAYTVRASIAETELYNSAETTKDFLINPKTLTGVTWSDEDSFEYDGKAHAPTATVSGLLGDDSCNVIISVEGEMIEDDGKAVKVGDYTAFIEDLDNANYSIPDDLIEDGGYYKEFSITKAPVELSVSIDNWTYGETASSPSVEGAPAGVTPTYKYKEKDAADTEYSETVPENAGQYTIQATVEESDNYEGGTSTADFEIEKASFTTTVVMDDWTYGGTASAPSVTNNPGDGEVTYQYKKSTDEESEYSGTKPSNAGEYNVKATIAESDNYKAGNAIGSFSILAQEIHPTVSIEGWTYGQNPNDPVVTGAPEGTSISFQYKENSLVETEYTDELPTDAGNYTIKATVTSDGNYETAEATADFTIAKKEISPSVTISDWIYGETASAPGVQGNPGNGTVDYSYKVKDADDETYDATKPTEAGVYTIRAMISATKNYTAGIATSDFEITKKDISPSVVITGWTYGETANEPSVDPDTNPGNGQVTFEYKLQSDPVTAYSETVPTKAGAYIVRATVEETENYNAGSETAKFNISKATITPEVSIEGWTYGEDGNNPVVTGNTGSGEETIEYKHVDAEDSKYTETKPTEAGNYTVRATIAASENYGGAEATADFTIAKAIPSGYEEPTDLRATYGDSLADVVLPVGWSWNDISSTSVGNVGTHYYVATYTPEDTANYELVEKEVSIIVEKADPDYTEPNNLTATYGQTLADVALTTGWTWDDDSESVGTVGKHNFAATFTPTDTVNYNTVEMDLEVTVGKADPAYTQPTGLTATYGQTLATVILPEGWSWKDSTTRVGDVGTNSFAAKYTPEDTNNYNVIDNVMLSVTVGKANPAYTKPEGLTATYGQTLAVVTLPEGWSWKDSTTSVGSAGENSFAATFTPSDTDNYNVIDNVMLDVTVGKADPTYTEPTELTATYGQTLAAITLPDGWSWKDSTTSVGGAGENSFAATFTPDDTDNYNIINNVMLSVTVGKADPAYTEPEGLTATYGQTLAAVTLPEGWSWKDSTTSVGDVGTNSFAAKYTPDDTDNYNVIDNVMLSVTVGKADPAYTEPTELTATYGQTLAAVTLPEGWSWKDRTTSVGNVGTNSFAAKYTPDDPDNYNVIDNVLLSVTVGKADPAYTEPEGLTATYGQTLAAVTLPEGWSWKNSTTSVGDVGTNSFSAKYTPEDTNNYNVIDNVLLSITVGKANPDYTEPEGLMATYGQTLAAVTLPEGWSWKDSTTSVGNVGTNSFSAKYTPEDTNNYNVIDNVMLSVTVGKADPAYTEPEGLTAIYGQTLAAVTLPEGWSWKNSTTSVGDAGTHNFVATFTPTDTDNYNTAEMELEVTVGKADPAYTEPTELTATYGQTLAAVTLPDGWSWKDSTTSVGNAGTKSFAAKYTPDDPDNYNVIDNVLLSVTVGKADPAYTEPEGLAATYGQTLAVVTLPNGWSWKNSTTSVGDVGTNSFAAKYTPDDPDNYNVIDNVLLSVTVGKADPVYTEPTELTATYGQTLAVVTLPEGWSWKDSTTSVGDAGEHSFAATFTPDDIDNYNIIDNVMLSVTVGKADPAYTEPEGLTATYGQTLAVVTLPNGWSWKNSTTSVGDVGTNSFAAKYTPDDPDNYNVIDNVLLSITVGKADPTYTEPTELTATYGQTLAAVTLPEGWSWKDRTTSVGDAGEHSFAAKYTPDDTDNYNVIDNVMLDVTVGKADPAYTEPTELIATYGQTLAAVTLPEGWSWKNSTTSVGDVGTHSFAAKYTPEDTNNYNTVEKNLTVTVKKATIDLTVSITGWTYGQAANEPVVTGIPEGTTDAVTYKYKQNAPTETVYSDIVPTTAGDYTIMASVMLGDNYEPAEATATFTIKKATITPTVAIGDWTYKNTPGTPSVQGNLGNGVVTYSYKMKGAADSTYVAEQPTDANQYTVRATIPETQNYLGGTATHDFTIAKANFNPIVLITNWTYGEDAHEPTIEENISGGVVSYTYASKEDSEDESAYSNEVPTQAGVYVVKATVAATENYNEVSNTADFSISKADIDPSVSIDGWVYNHTPSTPVVAGNKGNGRVTYKYKLSTAEDDAYSTGIPTAVGTYTLAAEIGESKNYNGKTVTANFDIIRDELNNLAVEMDGWTYGNAANIPVVSGTEGLEYKIRYKAASAEEDAYSETVPVNAGRYNVRVDIAQSAGYEAAFATSDFTIAKADSRITRETATSLVYNGTEQALIGTIEAEGGNLIYALGTNTTDAPAEEAWSINVPKAAEAATYYVWVSIKGDENHNNLEPLARTVEIAKAKIKTAPVAKSLTYTGADQELCTKGETGFGTIVYGTEKNGNYADSIPTGRNAASYTIYYKVIGNSNVDDTPGELTAAIAKKTAELKWSDLTFKYDGKEHCPTATVNNIATGDTCTVTVTGAQSKVGTHTATAAKLSNDNYVLASANTTSFTIGENIPTIKTAPVAKNLTENGNAQELLSAGVVENGTMLYSTAKDGSYSTEIPKGKDAGNYTVWYKVTGNTIEGIKSYSDIVPASIAVTIAKRPDEKKEDSNTEPVLKNGSVSISVNSTVYGGNAPTAVVQSTTNDTSNASIVYKPANAPDSAFSGNVPTEVGNYVARVTVPANKEYTECSAVCGFSITYLPVPQNSYSFEGKKGTQGWFTSNVSLVPGDGYQISIGNRNNFTAGPIAITDANAGATFFIRKADTGEQTAGIRIATLRIDAQVPQIHDMEAGGIYFADQKGLLKGTASDKNLDKVLVDGKETETKADGNGNVTFDLPSGRRKQKVEVTVLDKAGNETKMTVITAPAWMKSGVIGEGEYFLEGDGTAYKTPEGSSIWTADGDDTNYMPGITFYANEGDYTFHSH